MMNARVALACLLSVLSTATFALPGVHSVRGRVTSDDGSPLPDMVVCSRSYLCEATDSDGEFFVESDLDEAVRISKIVIRVSGAGYATRTVAVSPKGRAEIVLQATSSSPVRQVPSCGSVPARKTKGKWVGEGYKIFVPRGIKVIDKGWDTDYWNIVVRSKKDDHWMLLGGGPMWSRGLPSVEQVEKSVEILTRDLVGLDGRLKPEALMRVDIQGRYMNGNRWRLIGDTFNTISYSNMPPSAADFFDTLLTSLCVQ